MADSMRVLLSPTPLDVIADLSLADGDYTVENLGDGFGEAGVPILWSEKDAAEADVTTLMPSHVLQPPSNRGTSHEPSQGGRLGLTVGSGNLLYLWVRKGSAVVGITAQ